MLKFRFCALRLEPLTKKYKQKNNMTKNGKWIEKNTKKKTEVKEQKYKVYIF